jgi:hypothetical protein
MVGQDSFASDPFGAVVRILTQSNRSCSASAIKAELVASGADQTVVDREWPRVQRRLRVHPFAVIEGPRQSLTYRWNAPSASPEQALEALVRGGLPDDVKLQYTDVLHKAIADAQPPVDDRELQSRLRQAQTDVLRQLAEIAGDIEELLLNEAEIDVVTFRLRNRLKRLGLHAIGEAGGHFPFDRSLHKPVSGSIQDGTDTTVVRPGYVWRSPGHEVQLTKAIVEERP